MSSNPSCLSSATTTPKYSFTNKWYGNSCAFGATFTSRGLCEFTNDPTFRVYVSTNTPADLATNKVGEDLKITVKTAVDPNNPNSDPNNPNGNPNSDPNSANNGGNSSSSSSKGGFFSTTVIIIIIVVVIGLILSALGSIAIIYCMMKSSPNKVTNITKKPKSGLPKPTTTKRMILNQSNLSVAQNMLPVANIGPLPLIRSQCQVFEINKEINGEEFKAINSASV